MIPNYVKRAKKEKKKRKWQEKIKKGD